MVFNKNSSIGVSNQFDGTQTIHPFRIKYLVLSNFCWNYRFSLKNLSVFFHASFDSSGAYLSPDGFANA